LRYRFLKFPSLSNFTIVFFCWWNFSNCQVLIFIAFSWWVFFFLECLFLNGCIFLFRGPWISTLFSISLFYLIKNM
jgi:hypothetical protein